ncbi:uncharacterized protein LOC134200913 [Bombyx mori]|uniref:uncharacterized protein LOC134200913 n=1 Tax=Bombyx mori TaxID=7091 RepID=UPI00035022AE
MTEYQKGFISALGKQRDIELHENLITSKNDIAYLTDLYTLPDMNLQLQGDDLNLIKTKNVVAAFVAKLLLHKKNIGRLISLKDSKTLKWEIPDWVLDPFSNGNIAISPQLEEEFTELTTNEEIKIKYKNGYQQFWLQKSTLQLYPGLWSSR